MNAYQQSLKIKRDNYSGMEYAIATAVTKAKQKAEREKAELKAKAEREKKEMAISTAIKLKKNNIAIELIADATGLTVEEIEAL